MKQTKKKETNNKVQQQTGVTKQEQIDTLTLKERLNAPTPKFFQKLRIIGLALAAASGVLIAAPIALPAAVITIAGYLAVAGTVATAVSQVAVQS